MVAVPGRPLLSVKESRTRLTPALAPHSPHTPCSRPHRPPSLTSKRRRIPSSNSRPPSIFQSALPPSPPTCTCISPSRLPHRLLSPGVHDGGDSCLGADFSRRAILPLSLADFIVLEATLSLSLPSAPTAAALRKKGP
ncbi:hypothetical protein CLIM01_12506 [Colletotrichum limetticola]|uniref:Uncharacterized protein n=1 Tax=Colletotrichum limetticola TaxID=1209924 RepID=A0ABQ9PEW5_9PEZI|nr:hypothetical protein CLIM01_12506 [Colletotrichum limetticola]